MPLREPSLGKGSIAIFNLSKQPTVKDLVLFFGTFGKILEVEQPSQFQQNSTFARKLSEKLENNNNNNAHVIINNICTKNSLPKDYERNYSAVVHFAEIEDAIEAATNTNGITWQDSTIYVSLMKQQQQKEEGENVSRD
jgi:RNA recognition motif-containing protein